MTPDPELDGMNLTDEQAVSMSLHIVADWLRSGDGPEWEDLPNLGEYAYARLMDRLVELGHEMERRAAEYDATFDIDSEALITEAVR